MKIVSGTEKLSIIIENIKKQFLSDFVYSQNDMFNFANKISDEFIESILKKPLIFYANKGSISGSYHNAEFTYFSSYIYSAENLETLRYLKSVSIDIQDKLKVDWIIIDMQEDVRISSSINKIIFLAFWQKEKNKKNTSGKIDYLAIEELLKNTDRENYGKIFLKKFIKYVIYPLLQIKPPQNEYVYPNLRYIKNPNDIVITDKMNNNVYRYECCICGNIHSVVLTSSKIKNLSSSKRLISYNSTKDKIEFKCSHENTEYEGEQNPYFKPEKIGGFSLDKELNFDKAFLYLFERLKKEEDKIAIIDENDKQNYYKISKYINN